MRLISFAMVSLLAITVSAYPPHNPDTQNTNPSPDDAIQNMDQSPSISAEDMEGLMEFDTEMLDQLLNDAVQNAQQPQDAATHSARQSPGATSQDLGQPLSYILRDIREFQGISAQEVDEVLDATIQSAQQSDQNKVLVEMNRLTEALKIQDDRCFQMDLQINTEKQRDTEVRNIIDRAVIKLQETSLSSDRILELEKTIYDLKMALDQLAARHKEQSRSYEDVMTKRRDANAELKLLKENQEIIAAYNSEHGIQVELSPNSCYNMGVLTAQYDKALKRIDKLLVKQQTIDNAISVSNDDALKAKSKRLENTIQDLRSYSKIAKEILKQHGHSQPLDV
ncbi:hypothetical protein BASA50_001266 [Batrachochytrium salamandrivorans]|uniref:Uncharacterized protein n=1 Tax=Batrachochytrium salamandrivorans TaxID=1357716 RepID=A0ABQ8EYA6_9FUNG|nr:hypothetical protein BASA60_001521 [Batrachochytrium salamandrivorans]KAH6583561.1 hypothetical protein BASA60_001369 [Batrachochytrium salamandrivorans]KAH6587337.1 hypothetical protein BASA50_001266 [Batrachochytrium salamandrivorans]KAH9250795.1 hypothetical protein BASA81_011383 [Batrachochytrium salamandrivorans]KAH9267285.1 hypothetical protein BASA83_010018 [Batrachochytrium salamandrivorans]